MNRTYAATILATMIALPLGACGDDSSGGYAYATGYGPGCEQYTTCGSCTPVSGCGWCFNRHSGVCTTDPDQCAQVVSEFTWTWDPSGCPDLDASVAPREASATEASVPASDTGSMAADTGPLLQDVAAPSVDAGTAESDAASSPSDAGPR